MIRHHLFGLFYIGTQVTIAYINIDPAIEPGVFTFDDTRTANHLDIGDIAQRNLCAHRRTNRQFCQFHFRVAHRARVAQVDRVTFPAFNSLGNIHAPDSRTDDLLHIGNIQPVTRCGCPVDIDKHVAATHDTFGEDRYRAGNRCQNTLDLLADFLYHFQVGACHFDTHRGLDAGSQHIDTILDRHDPGIAYAGNFHQRIQLTAQLLHGHAFAPLTRWFQLYGRLDHRQRCRVGGRIGAADFTEYPFDFGNRGNQFIGLLDEFLRLASGYCRESTRHIQQVAFVEVRHEFRAKAFIEGPQTGQRPEHRCRCQCRYEHNHFRHAKHTINHGSINADQKTIHRVLFFGQNFATNKIAHEHRHQRDRQPGRRRHGIGLGECQWREHTAFLSFQCKHRQEAQGDNQ